MERLTEKQHLKLNKQEAYKLYMDTLHELALEMNSYHDTVIFYQDMVGKYSSPTTKKDNLYAF